MSNSLLIIAQKARANGLEVLVNPAGKLVVLMPFISLSGNTVTTGHNLCAVDNVEHLQAIIGA